MGILSFLSRNKKESRILTSADLAELLDGFDTTSGVSVSASTAIRFSTVWACVRLLAETIAQLPVHVYIRNRDGSRSRVTDIPLAEILAGGPNSWQTTYEYTEFMVTALAMTGNHYALVSRNGNGELLELLPFVPSSVTIKQLVPFGIEYTVSQHDGRSRTYRPDQITHVRGMSLDGIRGISPIGYQRETVGLATAAQQYGARLFKNGARPSGVIRHPATLTKEAYERLKKYWQGMYGGENIGKTAVLEEGSEYQAISMSNEDAQYLDVRQFQRTEICSIFRIPPHMIGDLTKASFSNITQQSLEFVKYTILPWCRRIESAMARDLLTAEERRKGFFVQYLVDGLERADIKTRYEAYRTGIFGGFLSPNEVRQRENMNPRPNGDMYLAPLNMVDSSESMTKPGDRAKPIGPRKMKAVSIREQLRAKHAGRFRKVAGMLIKYETGLVRAAIKGVDSPAAIHDAVITAYDAMPAHIEATFKALVREYAAAVRAAAMDEIEKEGTIDIADFVGELLTGLAMRHVSSSTGQLSAIIAESVEGEIQEAIEARLSEWENTRPDKIASREPVQQESAVSRYVWAAAGITRLQWVRRGAKSCPFCTDLDGKIVGIEMPFVDRGEYQPEGYRDAPWKVRGPKMHAPIHQGCRCVIVPVQE